VDDAAVQTAWTAWWPQGRGIHHWDAVGRYRTGREEGWLLVEAKANLEELESDCQAKPQGGRGQIEVALASVKQALGVEGSCDWLCGFYQYAIASRLSTFSACTASRRACSTSTSPATERRTGPVPRTPRAGRPLSTDSRCTSAFRHRLQSAVESTSCIYRQVRPGRPRARRSTVSTAPSTATSSCMARVATSRAPLAMPVIQSSWWRCQARSNALPAASRETSAPDSRAAW
jgi:hypothetical protein